METIETKAAVKKDRERDKRYRAKYGVGLDFYNALGELQGWRCGACGRHRDTFKAPLNLDHEHFKILVAADDKAHLKYKWMALTNVGGDVVRAYAPTKTEVIEKLKAAAMPRSIRGLLCPGRYKGCNRLLGRVDDICRLEGFVAYLKNPPAKKLVAMLNKI